MSFVAQLMSLVLTAVFPNLKVPVRTTSRSPVLSRRDSPLQGSGQQNSQAGQRNSTR